MLVSLQSMPLDSITVSDLVRHIIAVVCGSSWSLHVPWSGLHVMLVRAVGLFMEVPVFHPPQNPYLWSRLKSPFLAVHMSFHYFWQWQANKSTEGAVPGGDQEVSRFSTLPPQLLWHGFFPQWWRDGEEENLCLSFLLFVSYSPHILGVK